jgi:thiamine transport system permease protein
MTFDAPAASRPKPRAPARGGWWWGAIPLLFIGPFLLWPAATMLWRGLAPDGSLSGSALADVVTDRFYWERLWFTTWQASLSTALAVLVGLPAAYVFALVRFPGRSALRAIVAVPFVMPTIVVALAFQQLVGPDGWLNDVLGFAGVGPVEPLRTIWLILAAHVFYNVSIVARLVAGVWANVDPHAEEAARLLGAGRWAAFRHVTLPALLPAIASASALVFTFTFTSFGVVLILGGADLQTLEVVIFRLATRLVQLPEAAILSFVQLSATLTALVLYSALQRRTAATVELRADRAKPLRETTWVTRALLVAVVTTLGVLIVAPLAALVHGALTLGASGAVTAGNFTALFEDTGRISYVAPADAVRWSLTFALGATGIALVVGVAAAMTLARSMGRFSTLIDGTLMLPLAVPAVVLGLGYLLTFNRGWYDLRGSPWLVLIAHSLIAYPFVLRAVLAVLRTLDPHLAEAARTLGASPLRVWRYIELPISARAMFAGAVFAFAVSLGEFGATLLLRRREFATIPIAIFEALGRPGTENLGRALALATVLMAVTAVAFLLIDRLRYRDVGEF